MTIETVQGIERKVIDFYVVDNPNATEIDYEALRIPRPGPRYCPKTCKPVSKEGHKNSS
jgi:hypothetical protein